jgi:hypothetical protein
MSLRFAYSLMLSLLCLHAAAQALRNPSFEGPRGPARTPPGWEPCGEGSTPDTQPGSWQVWTPPSDGASYLSLICRGPLVPYPNRWERCQQALEAPLQAGRCYLFTIDLAHSASFAAGSIRFTGEATLRVWGGRSACSPAVLLWESGPVRHTHWETYQMLLMPPEPAEFLFLEAYYTSGTTYSGNLLLDRMLSFPDTDPCKPVSAH